MSGETNYYNRVIVVSMGPIAVSFANLIAYLVRRGQAAFVPIEQKNRVDNQHAFFFLLISYLVLPQCAKLQFQALGVLTSLFHS